ncbi:ABC transporter permease [Leucobacter chromiireducens]|uniref:ABC transporter permease n=1 Tax=Leucobacter chromiireducens TaxID=283877 RepID=UPI000F62E107|nr:ABC transporter permease [Leucobacter chromiireducens]
MTSTLLIDGSSAPTPAPGSAARTPLPGPGQTLGGVLRSERIKLSSLLSIRLTLLITVLAGLGISTLMAVLMSGEIRAGNDGMFLAGAEGMQSYLLMVSTLPAPFLALIFGVLGVFAISSEYSSGMILSTLTAVPKRTPVFAAKALVLAALSAATAALLVLGGLAVAVLCLPDAAAQLGSTPVVSGLLGTIAYLVLIALFAFGVAALLRSTAGGIAVVAGVTFVLPIVFQVLSMTGWEWVGTASQYLPGSLGGSLSQGLTTVPMEPGYWTALVAMVIWAAAAVVPAAILFARRDAR